MFMRQVINTRFMRYYWWLRRRWHDCFVAPIEHDAVLQQVRTDGRHGWRYSFMTLMSAAIAVLGLLLSSPAVVIGAMLISPLMGAIVSLGFSLCVVDLKQMKRALVALSTGIVLALAVSSAIVYVSPLTEATPEILARTRPNLFDLLVAIFSGLAGGYAVIRKTGGPIVGVAIATALMPPLAVVGYGIATANGEIMRGAFMLFMTNLLAISLSVTMLAKWYGFGIQHSPRHTLWQTILILGVFGALSLPLGIALRDIAFQSYVTGTARSEIRRTFSDHNGIITYFNVSFPKDAPVSVQAVVTTNTYQPNVQNLLADRLMDTLNRDVELHLDQVILASNAPEPEEAPIQTADALTPPATTIAPPESALAPAATTAVAAAPISASITGALTFPVHAQMIDEKNKRAVFYPKAMAGMTTTLLRQLENDISAKFPEWQIRVVPPAQRLPTLELASNNKTLATDSQPVFENIVWTLERWQFKNITVIGYTTSSADLKRGKNARPYKRAAAIADMLKEHGFESTIKMAMADDAQHGKSIGVELPETLPELTVSTASQAIASPSTEAP